MTLAENAAEMSRAANLLDVIEQANGAQIAFGEMRESGASECAIAAEIARSRYQR